MDDNLHKLKKEDLPLIITDAPVVKSWKTQSLLGRGMSIVGMIILALAAAITIFGPDYLYVNAVTGLTFWETVQLNPGLVLIFGTVIIIGGKATSNAAWNKIPQYVEKNFVLYNDSCKPSKDAELVGLPGENGELSLYYHMLEDEQEYE